MRRFQDEVRSALLKYALIPGFLIALICILLAAVYWERNIVARTEEEARAAGEIFAELTHDYESRAAVIAMHGIAPLYTDGARRSTFYENLYAELNLHGSLPKFYLLGSDRQILFQTHIDVPHYLSSPPLNWGVLSRMAREEGCVEEFVPHGEHEWDYVVGQAIHAPPQEGESVAGAGTQIEGYAVFVMSAQELVKRLQTGEKMHVVIVDRAGRVPFSTMAVFRDPVFYKIVPELAGAQGMIEVDGQQFYVVQEAVVDGAFTVYAILPVGSRITQFATGAAILLAVLLLMVPFIVFRVRRETLEKTRAMDEILAAFRAVRHGTLNRELTIRTGNEFEEIAGEYNRMVRSLVGLMRENEERARVGVISELRQLEAQFNPHFLFNTLENIKFMTKLEPDAAVRMITALSALLRYSIDNRTQCVTLAEDLSHLAHYVEIQRRRFGARLSYRQEIEAAAKDCLVPKLLLQPIVENAIHYGANAEGEIHISTRIDLRDGQLQIVIEDAGAGMTEETLMSLRAMMKRGENSSVHTGLYNSHRRIRLLYGVEYGLQIARRAEGGTRVTMVLPMTAGKEDEEDAADSHCRG